MAQKIEIEYIDDRRTYSRDAVIKFLGEKNLAKYVGEGRLRETRISPKKIVFRGASVNELIEQLEKEQNGAPQ